MQPYQPRPAHRHCSHDPWPSTNKTTCMQLTLNRKTSCLCFPIQGSPFRPASPRHVMQVPAILTAHKQRGCIHTAAMLQQHLLPEVLPAGQTVLNSAMLCGCRWMTHKRTGGAVQAHAGMHNQRGRCFTGACRHALCLQGPQDGACQPGQTGCTPHTKLAAPGVHRLPAQNEIATYCAKWCTVQPAYTDLQPAH